MTPKDTNEIMHLTQTSAELGSRRDATHCFNGYRFQLAYCGKFFNIKSFLKYDVLTHILKVQNLE